MKENAQVVVGSNLVDVLAALREQHSRSLRNAELTVARLTSLLNRPRVHYWRKEEHKGRASRKQDRLLRRLGNAERSVRDYKAYVDQVAEALSKPEEATGG